jgi:hypothetical protein
MKTATVLLLALLLAAAADARDAKNKPESVCQGSQCATKTQICCSWDRPGVSVPENYCCRKDVEQCAEHGQCNAKAHGQDKRFWAGATFLIVVFCLIVLVVCGTVAYRLCAAKEEKQKKKKPAQRAARVPTDAAAADAEQRDARELYADDDVAA